MFCLSCAPSSRTRISTGYGDVVSVKPDRCIEMKFSRRITIAPPMRRIRSPRRYGSWKPHATGIRGLSSAENPNRNSTDSYSRERRARNAPGVVLGTVRTGLLMAAAGRANAGTVTFEWFNVSSSETPPTRNFGRDLSVAASSSPADQAEAVRDGMNAGSDAVTVHHV